MERRNVDVRQLSHMNHINDPYTEYTKPEMSGWFYERITRHLGFSGDVLAVICSSYI